MEDSYEYVKADIAMEVDYPASQGVQAPETPKSAYVAYVIDTPGAKPGDPELFDGYEVTSVPANSREVVEWQGAYRRFDERVQIAHLTLQVAEQAWHDAMAVWVREIQEAAGEYAPVHEEIEARKAMVEAQDALEAERERKGREVIEEAAMTAEDAVLGNRSWVVYRRGPASANPPLTLHHILCDRYTKAEKRHNFSKPMRAKEAREALNQANVTPCRACKAEEHVRLATRPVPEQRSHPH